MVKEYLISIITVVKNGETTIEKCIKSVLNQNYKNIQYIIIDGNSNDQTKIFEVFRVEDEPTSWQDFYDKKVARIVNTATNGSFEDVIMPNKKYYYTGFRFFA